MKPENPETAWGKTPSGHAGHRQSGVGTGDSKPIPLARGHPALGDQISAPPCRSVRVSATLASSTFRC